MVAASSPNTPPTVADDVTPVFNHEPGRRARASMLPFVKTIGYTLRISAQFLGSALLGDGSIRRSDELLAWWSEHIFRSGNASLSAIGQSNLAPGQPYVFMSNHRSLLDIPASIAATPSSVRMVMKEELTRVPLWGRAMVASGFVPINRRNREKAIEQLERAKEHLENGVSIWVFPEGTRSRDGVLQSFKKGGFHVARQLGLPIVPTWIDGTADAIPPDSSNAIFNVPCSVRYGKPIPSDDGTLEETMEQVRVAIEALRPDSV